MGGAGRLQLRAHQWVPREPAPRDRRLQRPRGDAGAGQGGLRGGRSAPRGHALPRRPRQRLRRLGAGQQRGAGDLVRQSGQGQPDHGRPLPAGQRPLAAFGSRDGLHHLLGAHRPGAQLRRRLGQRRLLEAAALRLRSGGAGLELRLLRPQPEGAQHLHAGDPAAEGRSRRRGRPGGRRLPEVAGRGGRCRRVPLRRRRHRPAEPLRDLRSRLLRSVRPGLVRTLASDPQRPGRPQRHLVRGLHQQRRRAGGVRRGPVAARRQGGPGVPAGAGPQPLRGGLPGFPRRRGSTSIPGWRPRAGPSTRSTSSTWRWGTAPPVSGRPRP